MSSSDFTHAGRVDVMLNPDPEQLRNRLNAIELRIQELEIREKELNVRLKELEISLKEHELRVKEQEAQKKVYGSFGSYTPCT